MPRGRSGSWPEGGRISRSFSWAAASAAGVVVCRYEGATVSVIVASHTRLRPPRHGISVSLSGLFPSDRESLSGSLMLGISAFVRDSSFC